MEKTGVNRRNRKIVSASSKGDSAEPQVRSQWGLGNSSKGYGVQEISINCLPPPPLHFSYAHTLGGPLRRAPHLTMRLKIMLC